MRGSVGRSVSGSGSGSGRRVTAFASEPISALEAECLPPTAAAADATIAVAANAAPSSIVVVIVGILHLLIRFVVTAVGDVVFFVVRGRPGIDEDVDARVGDGVP